MDAEAAAVHAGAGVQKAEQAVAEALRFETSALVLADEGKEHTL